MQYCSSCGDTVALAVPEGDNRERYICSSCGEIHYQNPKIVTGCLPVWEDQVLLCRRAIEPRLGKWTLPAGFMENGETCQQGAARETWEEACAKVNVQALYTTMNLPHISQVYLMFLSKMTAPEFSPGIESLEVALFNEADVPWDELAFPVVTETLRFYFDDRKAGVFPHRTADILWSNKAKRKYEMSLLVCEDSVSGI